MLKKVILRIGIIVSAIGMIYSGLMFLGIVPADLSMRFWDGGASSLDLAGVLDIMFGSIMLYITINILANRDSNQNAKVAVIVCISGMVSDWIGGLYGISAFIGLVSSYMIKGEE